MSDTGSNFEMTGTLPGLELRKRKTPQEKNWHYSADNGARHGGVTCGAFALYSALPVV